MEKKTRDDSIVMQLLLFINHIIIMVAKHDHVV